jgi:hypothetical protein
MNAVLIEIPATLAEYPFGPRQDIGYTLVLTQCQDRKLCFTAPSFKGLDQ